MIRRSVNLALAALIAGLGSGGLAGLPAAAASTTYTIGIDNAPPSGHNWEFLDFFPNSGVNVHNGDILHFQFNTASKDGFHNATLGKPGDTPDQIAAARPNLAADSDDGGGQQQFSGFFGSNPPPGSGAPGACGDASTPCTYDGSQDVQSMALFGGGGTDFFFKVQMSSSPSSPTTINYICTVHGPAMHAQFTIVPDSSAASTQAQLDSAAASQYTADLSAGQAATAAVAASSSTTNSNGTHTVTVSAGTESADGRVQILEMIPASVNVSAGDTVKWTALSHNDPHTVTFPQGTQAGDPFPSVCEGSGGDTPATAGPPTFGCAQGALEIHYVPGAQGPTAIASASTVATSGVIDAGTYYGSVPSSYSFTFPSAGTFKYQCKVHDDMTGQVLAATPGLPASGAGPVAHHDGLPLLPLLVVAVTVLSVAVRMALVLRRTARGVA